MLEYSSYIDPSIFASLFAIIIASIVSAGMAIKLFWHKIKSRFT